VEIQRDGPRRADVFGREAVGDGRPDPQVVPARCVRGQTVRELLGDDGVGVQRQVRAVLFD
jgi:hypothetical protein